MNNNPQLENLDHQLFTSLINLKSISLKNSALSTLDPRLANLFKNLKHIEVSSKKFTCNCSVQWLNILLKKISKKPNRTDELADELPIANSLIQDFNEPSVVCSLPDSLNGSNLVDLSTEQLGCYEVRPFIPVIIAFVVAIFILIIVIAICIINCRMKRKKKDNLNKYRSTGDHLANLHSFSNGPSIINGTNNYAVKLGLYDKTTKTSSKSSTKLRNQNKVFSTAEKPLINELPHFDSMCKPPLISSNNFNDILMSNSMNSSKTTLINTNQLINHSMDDQPMIKCLTNPYQIVPVMPGYEQSYNQQLMLQQQKQKTSTLHPSQFINSNHFANQANFHTQQRFNNVNKSLVSRFNQIHHPHQQQQEFNEDNDEYSDHTYATILNGNEIYIGQPDLVTTINRNPARRLANSDCSSCSSEPLSRLSNDKPITEL